MASEDRIDPHRSLHIQENSDGTIWVGIGYTLSVTEALLFLSRAYAIVLDLKEVKNG